MADIVVAKGVQLEPQNAAIAARPGSKMIQDVLGALKQVDDQGVATDIGGGGGFGEDTKIDKANSTGTLKTILELIASYSTNVSPNEVSQWVLKLLNAGAQENSYLLTPTGLTVDTAGTAWSWIIKSAGSILHSIVGNVNSLTLNGESYVRVSTNGGTVVSLTSASAGLQMSAGVHYRQGTALTAASNLAPQCNQAAGGNVFIVNGNTQIDRITSTPLNNGYVMTLVFTGTPTIKHNQANSGGNTTIQLQGSVDLNATAGTTLTLALVLNGTQQWQEITRKIP